MFLNGTKLEKLPSIEIVFIKINMNRKVLVTLLWKEIRDLELITEGFLIMTEYPEEIVQLVVEKTESIQSYIQQLGQFKSEAIDFQSVDTSTVELETESPVALENLKPIIEEEIEEELIDTTKIPAFIVTSNQDVSIDDHFVELEDELYLNDDVEDVLETVEATNSETPLIAEPLEPLVAEVTPVSEETAIEIINIEPSKLEELNTPNEVPTLAPTLAPTEELNLIVKTQQAEPFDELPVEILASDTEPPVKEITTEQEQKVVLPTLENIIPVSKPEIIKPEAKNHDKITDIKQSISLGDRFRFQRDLFKSNGEDMNKTVKYINQLSNVNEAISFLEKKYQWDADDESAVDFYQIVKRRFL